MNEPWAYLNHRWIGASQAMISVADAGFVLGATISEQFRTCGGKLFLPAQHFDRFERSLATIGLKLPISRDELAAAAQELVQRNHPLLDEGDDLGLSLFATPGPYATFAIGESSGPTVGMHTYPLPFHLWSAQYQRGTTLVTVDTQPVPNECWPVSIKCRSRMHYYLADQQARAKQSGARALLMDEQGRIHDTSTATVILYFEAEGLIAPPVERILPGISAAFMAELAADSGLCWSHRDLRLNDLRQADEILLASTPFCLLPVTKVNDHTIGAGQPGDTYRNLLRIWSERIGLDIAAQAGRFQERVKS